MVYIPKAIAPNPTFDDLLRYVQDELRAISQESAETISLELRPVYVAPAKPRAGMLVYADGTSWNPGSGEGVYVYTLAGAWSKL